MLVVLPSTTEQVSKVLEYCHDEGIKVVPRGRRHVIVRWRSSVGRRRSFGTRQSSAAILEIDYGNRCVIVQPGVTNLAITKAVQAEGFYYAPDPSSQIACTIGGNVAENSGGVHCLKYG